MSPFPDVLLSFYHHGRRYAALAWSFDLPDSERIRVLTRFEAEQVLRDVMRSGDSAVLRGLYAELSYMPNITHVANEAIVGSLVDMVRDELGLAGRFTLVEVSEEAHWRPTLARPPTAALSPDVQRLTLALAELGETDLIHRGGAYRVLPAHGAQQRKNRDGYETLSEREVDVTLKEMADDPLRPQKQKTALAELVALHERGRRETQLLLLRRIRRYVRSADEGSAVTPSQLRRARERHWVAVEAVDENEQPVAGVRLELKLPDGDVKTLSTDEAGMARLAPVPAGTVTIRLLDLDGESWRALGGSGPQPSGAQGPVRSHVVTQGQCLSKIAQRYGIGDWRKIWDDPKNETLRKKRKSPHVLLPGDGVALPRAQIHEVVREVDAVHRIEIGTAPDIEVQARLQGHHQRALEGLEYRVSYEHQGAHVSRQGTGPIGPNGLIKERLPVGIEFLVVSLARPKLSFALMVSRLDPARHVDTDRPIESGVRARLSALGYTASGHDGAGLRQALVCFQRDRLEREQSDGSADAETLDQLEALYGA